MPVADKEFLKTLGLLDKPKETPHEYAERKAKNILERELRLPQSRIKELLELTNKRYERGMREGDYGNSYQRALKRFQQENLADYERRQRQEQENRAKNERRLIIEQYERERPEREARQRQEEEAEAKRRGYAEMDTGYDSGTGSESERESAEEQRVRAMNLHKKREEKPEIKDYSLVFGERHAEPSNREIGGASTGYGVHKMIGEKHYKAKLTADQVQEIRKDWWSHPHRQGTKQGASLQELAERYGVKKSTIDTLISRHTWYNLPFVENEPTEERLNLNEKRLVAIISKHGGTKEQLVRNKQGRLALPPEIALKEKQEAKAKREEGLTEEEKKAKAKAKYDKMMATRKANAEKKKAE